MLLSTHQSTIYNTIEKSTPWLEGGSSADRKRLAKLSVRRLTSPSSMFVNTDWHTDSLRQRDEIIHAKLNNFFYTDLKSKYKLNSIGISTIAHLGSFNNIDMIYYLVKQPQNTILHIDLGKGKIWIIVCSTMTQAYWYYYIVSTRTKTYRKLSEFSQKKVCMQ